jgi:hypothetical protein
VTLNEENIMNQSTLRSTLSVLGAVIGLAILNAPAWSADTARKGAPKSQRGAVKFNDIAITKGERQQPGDTPAGQAMLNNKNPDLTIVSPRDPASGQATGISWSGSDGDERQKSPTKGQASGSPTGRNVTGGTIPVYSDKSVPNKLGNFEVQDIVSPRDPASGQATGQYREGGVNDTTHIVSPRDSQSGLPHGIVSPRDPASGQATGKEAANFGAGNQVEALR